MSGERQDTACQRGRAPGQSPGQLLGGVRVGHVGPEGQRNRTTTTTQLERPSKPGVVLEQRAVAGQELLEAVLNELGRPDRNP